VTASPADDPIADGELARRISLAPAAARLEEEELCRRFAPRVRLYGLRHLGSPDTAEDLVQRVLTITIVKLREGAVREPDRIASFVLGVARMQSHEIRRCRRREEPLGPDAVDQMVSEVTEEPETLALSRLARGLELLPERERSVLLLTYFDGQSAEAIADRLGLTAGHVRVLRHRAIDRLRSSMDSDGTVEP
jgi:RNA polymerase sigma-70 factor, ECF subfamily